MHPQTVLELFKHSVKNHPDNVALHSQTRQVTYAELDSQSNKIANFLIQRNIKQEHLVPIVAHRSIELVIALLGVMKSTASFVPIDARQPDSRKTSIITQCSADLVLVTDSQYSTEHAAQTRSIIDLLDDPNASTTPVKLKPKPRDVVYVIFTSGTTGTPKGVVIEHHSLRTVINWHNARFDMHPDCRTTLMAGVGFDVLQWEVWATLAAGATLYVLPEETRVSIPALHDFYCKQGITHASVPAILVSELVRQPATSNLVLRFLFSAGEKLPLVDTSHLSYSLVDYYGPTETTIFATCRVFDKTSTRSVSSIGFPIAGAKVHILDETLKKKAVGEVGELFITGRCLARGYLARPDLTQERFINLPSRNQRAYRTGDLGRFLPDGSVQYLGRNDDQVKIRGNRIELGDIEAALLRHSKIHTAVVLIDEGQDPKDKRLIAGLVATAATVATDLLADVKAHMKREVPEYMLPSRYILLDAIPHTPNGKTDRQALKALTATEQALNGAIRVDNEIEGIIATVWQQHLRHADFTREDDFFDVGGNSLIAAEVLKRISEQLQIKTFIRDIYEAKSIRTLACVLNQRKNNQDPVSESEPVHELEKDINLSPHFDPPNNFNRTQLTSPKDIFLTGATGYVGAHLLEALLSSNRARIHCLVRAENPALAHQKVLHALERYDIRISERELKRIHTYAGDLSLPSFGLEQRAYDALCQIVQIAYHSASAVNFIQPYSYMKKDNVEGLKRIIDFAGRTQLKALMLLSTISVYSWGHLHTGKTMMYEQDDIDQNLPAVITDLGYVRSKWVMEKIADLAQSRGLPLMTFRLGYATCHSRTGAHAEYQWWGRLVQTCIAKKAVPNLENLREGLITVDYMVQAIAYISRKPRALGKKFNLIASPEKNLTLLEFFDKLGQHLNLKFKKLPYRDWVALWANDPKAPLYPLLSMFSDKIVGQQSTVELYQNTYCWDCANVRHFLEDSDIHEPDFNDQLFRPYLKKILPVTYQP